MPCPRATRMAILREGRFGGTKLSTGGRVIRLRQTILRIALVVVLGVYLPPASAQGRKATPQDALAPFKESLVAAPDAAELTRRQAVYVPVYSSVADAGGQKRLDFSVTLSIRNVADNAPLVLERIDYHDTAGKLVQHYLVQPVAIRPLGTIEIFIPTDDVRGGTGAKFIVGWAATGAMPAPVIQAVMVGGIANRSYALTTEGVPIPAPGN
jgi:hypothetical protein